MVVVTAADAAPDAHKVALSCAITVVPLRRVRAIIVTGGEKFFSAGADLNEALQVKSAADGLGYFNEWHRLNSTAEELAKPVIAAIEGFCITGGLEFALACDLRVAAEGATFSITSSRIGTVAGAGGTQRLPRIVGMAHDVAHQFLKHHFDAIDDPIVQAERLKIAQQGQPRLFDRAFRLGQPDRKGPL